jgi:hypothetical protein
VIKYKVQCAGVVGDECRQTRPGGHPISADRLIGTFLFKSLKSASKKFTELFAAGLDPKLVTL